jgi:hypothetical protein
MYRLQCRTQAIARHTSVLWYSGADYVNMSMNLRVTSELHGVMVSKKVAGHWLPPRLVSLEPHLITVGLTLQGHGLRSCLFRAKHGR